MIENAQTELVAPVVFAPKTHALLRSCIHYRKMNAMSIRNLYPIPRIDESIDSLQKTAILSAIRAHIGSWQVKFHEAGREKSNFTFNYELHKFVQKLSGLKNLLEISERAADSILWLVRWRFALVYLDIMGVSSRFQIRQIERVRQMINLLKNSGLILNLKKYGTFTNIIGYLGHAIRPKWFGFCLSRYRSIQRLETTNEQLRVMLDCRPLWWVPTVHAKLCTHISAAQPKATLQPIERIWATDYERNRVYKETQKSIDFLTTAGVALQKW